MSDVSITESHDANELGQYRSLSSLAVISLLLGLASALTFASSALIVVPLAAVAVAVLALARIRSSAGALTGGRLALAGIVLAIVFGVAAQAHVYVRDSLSIRYAQDFAHQWLSLVASGQHEASLELISPPKLMSLRPEPAAPDVPRPPFDPQVAVEMLKEDPLLLALEPAQPTEEVAFRNPQGVFSWTGRRPQVACNFSVIGTRRQDLEVTVVLTRYLTPQDEVVWLVALWNAYQRGL